jgi:hypothetical protein
VTTLATLLRPDDEHRRLPRPDQLVSHASEHQALDPTAAMGSHGDEIDALRVGQLDERFADVGSDDDGGPDAGPSLPQVLSEILEIILCLLPLQGHGIPVVPGSKVDR